MGDVFQEFRDDPELRVAIITGGGEKFFCPGWDLKAAADGDAVDGDYGVGGFRRHPGDAGDEQAHHRGGERHLLRRWPGTGAVAPTSSWPPITSSFALPEIRSGTVADAASVKLPKRIPYHIAMEMLLTGRWIDAEEAARWGMINRIHPAGSN